MEKQSKIKIICVYFNKLPNYFRYWLASTAWNPTIDFLIVTDQSVENTPRNVRILPMNLDDFSHLASKKIGMNISLKSAYKCCDFKVAYGKIFEDELQGYDFWGHCDIDLVWGNLRHFITEEKLSKYDRIFPLGHLSLYRNSEMMVNAFRLEGSAKGDYSLIFSSDNNFAFDELGGMYQILQHHHIPQYDEYDFADISPVYKQFKVVTSYVKYDNNYHHQMFVVGNGKVTRYFVKEKDEIGADEFAYIHFQKRKFTDEMLIASPSAEYTLSARGFRPIKDEITPRLIRHDNPYSGKVMEWLEWKKRNYCLRKGK